MKRQPAGIPVGGQFAANDHDEANSSLFVALPVKIEERGAILDAAHTGALVNESITRLAAEMERYGGESGSITIDFDDRDSDPDDPHPSLSYWGDGDDPDGFEVSDWAQEAIPEGWRNGSVRVEAEGGSYSITMSNTDSGEERTMQYGDGARKTADEMDKIAQGHTDRRATLRDEREKIALVEAFEQASVLDGSGSIEFTPKSISIGDGEVKTLSYGTSYAIAPHDEWQARAFGFYGQGVKTVTITRDEDGYTVERELTNPYNEETKMITDRVTADSESRWGDAGLFWAGQER